jgi:hypothetical protein
VADELGGRPVVALDPGMDVARTANRSGLDRERPSFGLGAPPRIAAGELDLQELVTVVGIYGEMWVAAMVSGAFVAGSAREAVETSLEHVPPRSRLAEVIRGVLARHSAAASWDDTLV